MNTTGNFLEIRSPGPILDSVYLLDQNEFPKPWPRSDWESLNWEHHFLFTQCTGQEALGFSLFSSVKGDETAHLLKVCVASELRGSGTAQALWSFSMGELRKMSVKSIYLEVEIQNSQAIGFYEKLGFLKLRRIDGYYSDGGAAQTMQLTI